MTLKAFLTAAALAAASSCAHLPTAGAKSPAPGTSGGATSSSGGATSSGGGRSVLAEQPYPIYWCVNGDKTDQVNFAGLPIHRGASFMFYEHTFGRYPRIYIRHGGTPWPPENGGVPQNTDWPAHIEKAKRDIAAMIPDPDWDGYAILDFEGWEPVWEILRNEPIKEMSRALVRERFPSLTPQQVEQRAAEEFEAAAMDFLLRTLRLCKQERPRAKWGFYGYPYPYQQPHADKYRPLFDEVDAFYPQVYVVHYSVESNPDRNRSQGLVDDYNRGTDIKIRLARQWAGTRPVVAVMWCRYHDMNRHYGGRMLNDRDFRAMLRQPRISGADAALFWDYLPTDDLLSRYNAFFSGPGGQVFRAYLAEFAPQQPAAPSPITGGAARQPATPRAQKAAAVQTTTRSTAPLTAAPTNRD